MLFRSLVGDGRGQSGGENVEREALVQERLFFPVIRKVDLIGPSGDAGGVSGEDAVPANAGAGHDVDVGVSGPVVLLVIVPQGAEHGSVLHPVAVDDGVEIAEALVVPAFQEDGAQGAALAVPGPVKVIVVVSSKEQGVGDFRIRNQNPAQHVGIDFLKGGEVDGGERFKIRVLLDFGSGLQTGVRRRRGEFGDAFRLFIGRPAFFPVSEVPNQAAQASGENQEQYNNQDCAQSFAHSIYLPIGNGIPLLPAAER